MTKARTKPKVPSRPVEPPVLPLEEEDDDETINLDGDDDEQEVEDDKSLWRSLPYTRKQLKQKQKLVASQLRQLVQAALGSNDPKVAQVAARIQLLDGDILAMGGKPQIFKPVGPSRRTT